MLKRKLHRASFLTFGLLILAAGNIAQPVDSSNSKLFTGDSTSIVPEAVLSIPPVKLNKQADKFVKKFVKQYNYTLTIVKQRGEIYFPLLDSILEINEVPVELKYLAVIESNLKPVAKSRVGARGMWQLMPTTARTLGLTVKKSYDERIMVSKSTAAAATYLKDLYKEFGDWLLVIAAYNAGSGNVRKAIRNSGSKNFWALQNFLPLETRNHVKRYIGVHVYFEGNPGLTTLTKKETENYFKIVKQHLEDTENELAAKEESVTLK